jgi:hypothetical protein
MHIQKIALITLLSALASGCGALVPVVKLEDISAEQRHAVNEVAIYNQTQLIGRKFKVQNIVEGISCKNKMWDHAATKSDAIFQTRYWAQQIGADGITNLQCDQPRGTTTSYNCWESITCTAEAIKFE